MGIIKFITSVWRQVEVIEIIRTFNLELEYIEHWFYNFMKNIG